MFGFIKGMLRFMFPPFFFSDLKKAGDFAAKENTAFSNLVNYPSEENAVTYIELMKNRPAIRLSERNHPDDWAVLREKWQIINHSNKVPTNLKKEVLDILIGNGLYVRNSKIIDNYKNSD